MNSTFTLCMYYSLSLRIPQRNQTIFKKFFISDSYNLIVNANDQNNIVSKIWENPYINYFSTYRLCIDKNLIDKIPRITYKGNMEK